MGRVDEAMRRAAESAMNTDRGTTERGIGVGPEVHAEAFPTEERAELPRLRSVKKETRESAERPTRGASVLPPLSDRMSPTLSRKVVIDTEIDPLSREQYRRLATGLHATQASGDLKAVAVVSALASEGKSLSASNLALTLSESYQRSVLLIDGDLRRPSIDSVFGLPSGNGLSDGLLAAGEEQLSLHRVTPYLTVLTSGQPTADPMAALSSDRMRQLVDEARETFDWVIIDTPPIGLLSDASLLADIADGVLLVVKAEATPYDVVQRAVAALGKDRILGVILNQAKDVGPAGGYQTYYRATSGAPAVRK